MGVLRASCALAAAVALGAGQTAAYKIFQEKLPNGGNVPGVMALGHDRPDSGGPNNDFGLDFIGAMFKWTKEFCEKDSDGDGQTNGQELGDPCCEFEHRVHEQVRWTEGVSHPGDAAFTSDPKLWEGIVCGAAEPAAAAQEAAEPEDAEQKTQEKTEQETQEETVQAVQKAEQDDAVDKKGSTGAPALQSSVMLSGAALTVVVLYFVVMRTGRRSTRNLPIFRQRRGPM